MATNTEGIVTECKDCKRHWLRREGEPCPECGVPVVRIPVVGQTSSDPLVSAFNNYDKLHKLTEQIRAENALLVELTERQRRLVDAYEQALERIANEHRWAQEDYRHFASAVLGKAKE